MFSHSTCYLGKWGFFTLHSRGTHFDIIPSVIIRVLDWVWCLGQLMATVFTFCTILFLFLVIFIYYLGIGSHFCEKCYWWVPTSSWLSLVVCRACNYWVFLRSGGQVDISYYLILSAFIMDRHAFYFHLDAGVMPPCPSRIELGGGVMIMLNRISFIQNKATSGSVFTLILQRRRY